ncbi:MAG: hypothetical protein OXN89_04920 [Bryobacterales bacterium]|nr:hypothetical protein [Bryobacterales bacterium]
MYRTKGFVTSALRNLRLSALWVALTALAGPLAAQVVQVQLGDHGGTASLTVTGEGQATWEGMQVVDGSTITGANGLTYVLIFADGEWTAQYLSQLVRVMLGDSGRAITLERMEDGEYWWGGPIQSGLTVRSSDGIVYRLVLSAGTWTAMPLQSSVSIPLGDSGESVSLQLLPGGAYTYNGRPVTDGFVVTVSSGMRYELRLSEGEWVARPYQEPTQPTDPTDPSEPTPPTTPTIVTDVLTTYVGIAPTLVSSEDGVRNAVLRVGGSDYLLSSLSSGQSLTTGETFAGRAMEAIAARRRQIELYEIVYEDRPDDLLQTLQDIWDQSHAALGGLFDAAGASEVFSFSVPQTSQGRVDVEEVKETMDAVIASLETFQSFRTALGDGGILEGALDIESAQAAYEAVTDWSALQFGATQNTRFGAYLRYQRPEGSSWQDSLQLLSGEEGFGAFAYSPLPSSVLSSLPISGTANYSGRTVAVSPLGGFGVYSGTINLQVRFAARSINGVIRGLANDAGELLTYSQLPVSEISLPAASLGPDASFSVQGGTGALLFESLAVPPPTQSVFMDMSGQILGSGLGAAEAIIGTWSVNPSVGGLPELTGAYGAERRATSAPSRPATDTDGLTALAFIGARPDDVGNIRLGGADASGAALSYWAGALYTTGSAEILGPTAVSLARRALADLAVRVSIWATNDGDPQFDQDRANLWSSANTILHEQVFGQNASALNILGASYPIGSNRDSRALDSLDVAVEALSSVASFGASLQSGGVFEDASGIVQDPAGTFAAPLFEVDVAYGHTNYARFGVWARTVRDSAVSAPTPDATTPSGAFAYSPLAGTVLATSALGYPSGGVGHFVGQALAMEVSADPTAYVGDIRATVSWGQSIGTASLTAVISGLANPESGDALTYQGVAVEEIAFGNVGLSLANDGTAFFSDSAPSVIIRVVDTTAGGTAWNGAREIIGQFVGDSPDGPHGVIGTWSLGFATPIEGAFGADAGP